MHLNKNKSHYTSSLTFNGDRRRGENNLHESAVLFEKSNQSHGFLGFVSMFKVGNKIGILQPMNYFVRKDNLNLVISSFGKISNHYHKSMFCGIVYKFLVKNPSFYY